MNELLSQSDLVELTGRKLRNQQCEELERLGLPFRRVGVRVLVSREHLRRWLEGVEVRAPAGPRLDRVR